MGGAMVPGGASAIGSAVATRLERDGWTVARNELPGVGVNGHPAPADGADPAQVAEMVERVEEELGPVALLVNNAAAAAFGAIDELPERDFWQIIDVNLGGAFFCAQACTRSMVQRGFGRIITLSSEWGQIGWVDATAYCASKTGLISLTKALARPLRPSGITVNPLAPSGVDTPRLPIA